MKNKPTGFWMGLILTAGGLGLWAYRIAGAANPATCSPIGLNEFVPLL